MPNFTPQDTLDITPLKNGLRDLERMLKLLDKIIGQHSESISRTLTRMVIDSGAGRRGNALQQLAMPVIGELASTVLGEREGRSAGVNIAMHVATPDVNSFRMSQGQILAEAAAAIARATRRNL